MFTAAYHAASQNVNLSRKTAWVLAKAVAGLAVNGEADALPEPFKGMARALAEAPDPEARAMVWDGMAIARPELVEALVGVDPDAPCPEGDEADDWPPLALAAAPSVDSFPVEVLPEAAAALVSEGASAIGCPPDFLAVPVLTVAAGVIGRSASLLVKPGYFAPASLYAACVGPPSDGKTPGLKAVAAAVRRIDHALHERHRADHERWEEEAKRPGPDGKKADPGKPPRPRRIVVDDATLETVPLILTDNPRGLVMVRDELSALFLGLNQYKAGGKGSDRPTLLKIWSNDDIIRDRVSNSDGVPVRCSNPCLSIVGGLPPDMLGSLADPKGRADGFIDRFLFTYPDSLPVASWSERGIPEAVADEWAALVARLWQRPMAMRDDRMVPHVARFTVEGRAAWQARFDAHAEEMNSTGFDPALRGPWGKFRDYAGRFALILAFLDYAADPTANPEAIPNVDARSVANAWRLVAYFKSHARRVHAAVALGSGVGGGRVVRAIVDWIKEGQRLTFTERDITQARRWVTDDDLARALDHLARCHAIRPREAPDTPRIGRPPTPTYDVNPALLNTQNPQNPQKGGADPSFECFECFEKPCEGDES